ncbi:hypothetical protein COP2_031663 [Malus domestica]
MVVLFAFSSLLLVNLSRSWRFWTLWEIYSREAYSQHRRGQSLSSAPKNSDAGGLDFFSKNRLVLLRVQGYACQGCDLGRQDTQFLAHPVDFEEL